MANQAEYDALYQILLVGDPGVGKTCLLLRYADDTFTDGFISNIGVDFKIRTVIIAGKTIKLQIWEIEKSERFRTTSGSVYRGSDGIIVVFDLTDEDSFRNTSHWVIEIDRHCYMDIPLLLAGNKADLVNRRVVDYDTAKEMAERNNIMHYTEVSAKSGQGVEAMFEALATKMMDTWSSKAQQATGSDIKIVPMARDTSIRECCNIL